VESITMDEKLGERIARIGKEYLLPIITAAVVTGMLWQGITNRLSQHELDLIDVKGRVYAAEREQSQILQRLASIDTKLEYIIKSLDKLSSK